MKNVKHTPGPWLVLENEGVTVTDSTGSFGIALATRDKFANADARLIAAAPELLEVLKHVEQWTRMDDRMDKGSMVAVVKCAIAKATGDAK